MSSELEPFEPRQLMRGSRQTARAVSRYQSAGQLRVAQVDVETDVTLAKSASQTYVSMAMLGALCRVAQCQRSLELLTPEAAPRMALIADDHAIGLMELNADHRRRLQRL
jgi:hypothetical protein